MTNEEPLLSLFVRLVFEHHEGQKWNQRLKKNIDNHFPTKFVYANIVEMAYQRSWNFFRVELFKIIEIYNSLILLC